MVDTIATLGRGPVGLGKEERARGGCHSRLGKDMIGAEARPPEVSGEDVQAVGAWENRTEERRHACNGEGGVMPGHACNGFVNFKQYV